MKRDDIIRGKRMLIVDDEKDVIDVLAELLSICKIDTATSFAKGKALLETNDYDLVILDIAGVDGFELLKVAKKRRIPALMLTANSLDQESLQKAVKCGAHYYAPKEEMSRIDVFIGDVLEAERIGKSSWIKLAERLGAYYDKKFGGTDWRDKEIEYWTRKAG